MTRNDPSPPPSPGPSTNDDSATNRPPRSGWIVAPGRAARGLSRWIVAPVPDESRVAFTRDLAGVAARAVVLNSMRVVGMQLLLSFGGDATQATIVASAPFVGLLLSMVYVDLTQGRSPLSMLFWAEVSGRTALFMAGVALAIFMTMGGGEGAGGAAPSTTLAWVLTAGLALSLCIGQIGTPFLGAIYGAIYPGDRRGKIVSITRMLHGLTSVVAGLGLGLLFEAAPMSSGFVIAGLAVVGIAATWWFCSMPRDLVPNSPVPTRRFAVLHVLRKDKAFRRFQLFQFMLGAANLGALPFLEIYVREELALPISLAVLVVHGGVISQGLTLLTVRFHGGLFDRIGVLRHRALTSGLILAGWVVWVFADTFAAAIVAASLVGLGMAGGQLVWLLGSLSFAPKEEQGLYTGAHTFLTGVRGVLAPAAFLWLMTSTWSPIAGDYRGLFTVSLVLMAAGVVGHLFFTPSPRMDPSASAAARRRACQDASRNGDNVDDDVGDDEIVIAISETGRPASSRLPRA